MAKPTLELITALRATADRIENGVKYQWTHMGSCNCGHLAQTLTNYSKATIHKMALETAGDWSEQAREFCSASGYPIDEILTKMVKAGLNVHDIADLERLSDDKIAREVIARHPDYALPLDFRSREQTVAYMRTWADQLETSWRERHEKREAETTRQPELQES